MSLGAIVADLPEVFKLKQETLSAFDAMALKANAKFEKEGDAEVGKVKTKK